MKATIAQYLEQCALVLLPIDCIHHSNKLSGILLNGTSLFVPFQHCSFNKVHKIAFHRIIHFETEAQSLIDARILSIIMVSNKSLYSTGE